MFLKASAVKLIDERRNKFENVDNAIMEETEVLGNAATEVVQSNVRPGTVFRENRKLVRLFTGGKFSKLGDTNVKFEKVFRGNASSKSVFWAWLPKRRGMVSSQSELWPWWLKLRGMASSQVLPTSAVFVRVPERFSNRKFFKFYDGKFVKVGGKISRRALVSAPLAGSTLVGEKRSQGNRSNDTSGSKFRYTLSPPHQVALGDQVSIRDSKGKRNF